MGSVPSPFWPNNPPARPGKNGLSPAGSPGGRFEFVVVVLSQDLILSNGVLVGGKGSPGGNGSGGRPR